MRRAKKNQKWVNLKNVSGYTLTELLVVMGVTAMLMLLTFGGMFLVKKTYYIQNAANRFQSEMRQTFIDIVSTTEMQGPNCGGDAPKVKALRMKLGVSSDPFTFVSYCETPSDTLVFDTKSIDISTLNYKQDIELKVKFNLWNDADASMPANAVRSNGYVYFIYTSPYGKHYSYYFTEPQFIASPSGDPFLDKLKDTTKWNQQELDQAFYPTASEQANTGYDQVTFDSDTNLSKEGSVYYVNVEGLVGGVESVGKYR